LRITSPISWELCAPSAERDAHLARPLRDRKRHDTVEACGREAQRADAERREERPETV
jgi:hypothetical protein